MEEIWKDAVGYEKYFRISNLGRVYSKRTNKLLKTPKHSTGYNLFCTRLNGRKSKPILLRVHRLVAEAFIDNPDNKPFINHIDGIKTNNMVSNLEWVTAKENTLHSFKIGLQSVKSGCESKTNSLSINDIGKIFKESKKTGGNKTASQLSRELNVHRSCINRVLRNETYVREFDNFKNMK